MEPEEMRRMSLLFDFYGGLLSERQRELCELCYNDDLSLSEIAENTGITRQGVRDGLKKAGEILRGAEERLGFCAAWRARVSLVDEIEKRLAELGVSDEALRERLRALRA